MKSSRVPLAALGTFSLAPSATLSFHEENSAIAEGLVPLRVPGLDFTGLVVLCFRLLSAEPRLNSTVFLLPFSGVWAPGMIAHRLAADLILCYSLRQMDPSVWRPVIH